MSPLPYGGPIRFHPSYIQLEDRAVPGKWWTMFHQQSDERWGITDSPIPRMRQGEVRRYAAYEEPYVGTNPRLRFFVRGGRVGIEVLELPSAVRDRDQAYINTRVGQTKFNLYVTDGGWRQPGDVVGYKVLRDD